MQELQVFKFNDNEVRTIVINDEPWFVLKDLCEILNLSNPTAVAERLDDDERTKFNLGRQGKTNIVNESGLYTIILRSDKPQAKTFRKWVTNEVLPTIRKHGAYMTEQTLEQALTSPDFLIKLATELKEEKEKRKALEVRNSTLLLENETMQPKAAYFDDLVDRNLLTSIRETAKELGIKERQFIKRLIEDKYLYRNKKGVLMPYADKNDGLFELKEYVSEKNRWKGVQTLVTPKGRETFRLLFKCNKAYHTLVL